MVGGLSGGVSIFTTSLSLAIVACSGSHDGRNDAPVAGAAGVSASSGSDAAGRGTVGGAGTRGDGGSAAGVSGGGGSDATSGASGGAGTGGAASAGAGTGGSRDSGGVAGALPGGNAGVGGTGAANGPGCREGTFRSKTYFVCAHTGTDRMTAESFCQSRSEHLLKLDDAEEEAWAVEFVTEPGSIWIGANDLDLEDDWRWADGSAVAGYMAWAMGQPNDNLGREDCAVLHSGMGEWNDVACTETIFGANPMSFICEP